MQCLSNQPGKIGYFWLLMLFGLLQLSGCSGQQSKPDDVSAVKTGAQTAKGPAATELTLEQQTTAKSAVELISGAGREEPDIKVVPIPEMAGKSLPESTRPDHFVVTSVQKDASHPKFGQGDPVGFVVNGVQGKELVVERGKTYFFDVATDLKHDVYISTKEIGWGSSAWTEGVEGAYIYKGLMKFVPGKSTPDVLYYSCRNHPYMGGKINVVNPGETLSITTLGIKKGKPSGTVKKATKQGNITAAMVDQKLMFADMLVKSKTAQRVKASNIKEAVDRQNKAFGLLDSARTNLNKGDNATAYAEVESALKALRESARLVPSDEAVALLKNRHQELLTSLKNFEESHAKSYARIVKKQGKSAAVEYDKKEVADLKSKAVNLAKSGAYGKANHLLEQAQGRITGALQKMLESRTIVYDLNFESEEEEYDYELKRFGGYEELIPVAIEAKKPTQGAIRLMESFLAKARKMRDAAKSKAKEGGYPMAIAMLQDATKEVRRALRMVGVTQ